MSNWVVYAKQPFAGTQSAVEYMARYTHKIAISNHRIQNIEDGKVSFSYKDYKQGSVKKEMTLNGMEFIRRFSLHILPKKFVRTDPILKQSKEIASNKRAHVCAIPGKLNVDQKH